MEQNHWNGKKWVAYGTSMTSIAQGKYVPTVEKLSGLRVVNYGIPGGSLTPDGWGKGSTKAAVLREDDEKMDADLITLEVLPNEGAVLGEIYDTDDQSFTGCLNTCLRFLQEKTRAQVVLILMILGNDTPPEQRAARGTTPFEFAEAARKVAKINGVPVIDIIGEGGFGYARVKNRDYQVDNIHLNDKGGEIMGRFVWSRLKDIPLWEED